MLNKDIHQRETMHSDPLLVSFIVPKVMVVQQVQPGQLTNSTIYGGLTSMEHSVSKIQSTKVLKSCSVKVVITLNLQIAHFFPRFICLTCHFMLLTIE